MNPTLIPINLINNMFSSEKSKNKFFIVLALVIFSVILISYFSAPLYTFFKNPDKIKDFVLGFGVFSPAAFILLQILQVLIAPIPGQITGFVSGYIYGTINGTIYSMIGTVIGSFIAFVLSRKLGRPFVERVINKKTLKKFDYISGEKGTFALFLIFLLPALPDDAICFIAGLTKIPIRKLILIAFLGRLPGFLVLNMVGSGVANSEARFSVILFSVLMVVSFLIYIYRKKLESFSARIVKNHRSQTGCMKRKD